MKRFSLRWTPVWALLVAALAFGAVACGSDDDGGSAATSTAAPASTEPAAEPAADGVKGKNIYYVGAGDVNPWTKAYNHGVIDALTAQGAEVTYLQDPYDPQIEVQNLNRAIAAKPDLILLLGLDYRALVPGMTKAKAQNIPVINLSSPPGPLEPFIVASIESGHAELGKFAAQNLIDGLKAQGKDSGNVIMLNGTTGLTQVATRVEAFKKELERAPGIKVVAEEDANWDQATSQKLAQQLFAKYRSQGGIQGAYGMADNMAMGILQAAEQAGVKVGGEDGLVVVSSNCYKFGLDAVKAGKIYGTATQSPFDEAKFTAETVTKYLNGEEIPARSFAPEERITADNVDDIAARNLCP